MMPELPFYMLNVFYDTASPVDDFDVPTLVETVKWCGAAKSCSDRRRLCSSAI